MSAFGLNFYFEPRPSAESAGRFSSLRIAFCRFQRALKVCFLTIPDSPDRYVEKTLSDAASATWNLERPTYDLGFSTSYSGVSA